MKMEVNYKRANKMSKEELRNMHLKIYNSARIHKDKSKFNKKAERRKKYDGDEPSFFMLKSSTTFLVRTLAPAFRIRIWLQKDFLLYGLARQKVCSPEKAQKKMLSHLLHSKIYNYWITTFGKPNVIFMNVTIRVFYFLRHF